MSMKGTSYYDLARDATSNEDEREQLAQMLYWEDCMRSQEPPVIQCHKCGGRAYDLGDVIDCESCGKIQSEDYDEGLPF